MSYCLNLEGDEDGDLRSAVTTDAIVAAMIKYIAIPGLSDQSATD